MQDQLKKLRSNPALKDISDKELIEFVSKKYNERRTVEGRIYNNATSDNSIVTVEQFINMYLNKPYILSGYSCFYKNQDNSVNISSAALENLGDMRKFNKKKMEDAEHGSDEYTYYKVLQLTYKVLMNSYYGILGEKNSVFYNPFVQNSITMTGQDLITTSIVAMENFLSNNVPFECTDDIITFISNIKEEKYKFNISEYIDAPVSTEKLYDYLINHKKEDAIIDTDIVQDYVQNLSAEMSARVYYKNQLSELIQNSYFRNKLENMVQYVYSEKPAAEMEADLNDIKEKILEFCYYDYLYEDRYKRAMKDKRQTIITIDTDLTKVWVR